MDYKIKHRYLSLTIENANNDTDNDNNNNDNEDNGAKDQYDGGQLRI